MESDRSAPLPPPAFAGIPEYGASLSDAAFWAPYVAEALARHGLPIEAPVSGEVGSFPTFLAGGYAVKFFGELFTGGRCFEVERSLHRLLRHHPDIPAPALIAEGRLFEQGWPWPYLITTRLIGRPWREAAPSPDDGGAVAEALGRAIRRVHDRPAPAGAVWEHDLVRELRPGCVERHRQWRTLPEHLIEQIDRYLLEPSPDRRLLHADLHADHIFVDGARLLGVIDWGDATVADPYYELPALHLGTFGGDRRLLGRFLAGYGWEAGADFARRAMSMTLLHQFNVLSEVRETIDVNTAPSLEALADLLWALP